MKNGGRLVTFERGIPIAAVAGADAKHLFILGAPAPERAA